MTDQNTPSPDEQDDPQGDPLDGPQEPGSGNRWEGAASPLPAPPLPAPPDPATGPYPVVGAPTARRRRVRSAAAASAAAVIAGFGGFVLGHVTASDDMVPASTQVDDGTGEGPGEHGRFGDRQPPGGQVPGGQVPDGQAPDGVVPDRS